MSKRGFSATTAILVAVLIGALFMVGRIVTPPPPGPPEPPKEPVARPAVPPSKMAASGRPGMPDMPPGKMGGKMTDEQSAMMRQMQARGKMQAHQPAAPKFNPTSIDVTPDYFKQAKQGAAGEAAMRQKVEEANKEMAAQRQAAQAKQLAPAAGAPGAPSPSPVPHG